ncbi:hypothetical protein NADFUDRAFT_82371 [Nadsonia fulvescens var. elongata DSM 6958]|uniref:YCII-related domain-containing protein n=1 Tax=Nadsonia fulvescens var. elongata DSM 6958 TaxID=857566 RepID=A0A1E3PMP9_9ASCO|nr:hypothetical protein NADFUDRAFT_82371 [Nadsonia fulvescens var. elongata DSM 6958]
MLRLSGNLLSTLRTLLFVKAYPGTTHTFRMSSTTALKEYLCIVPDKKDTLAGRMKVRPIHVEKVSSLVEQKIVTFAGGFADEHPAEGEIPGFLGSCVVIRAESKDKVWEILKSDIYTETGVWDIENAQVHAMLTAFRAAK